MGVKIDGVRGAPTTRVPLDEFFDRPAWVDVRVMSPYGRALVREILMEGFEVGEMDPKKKTADVKAHMQGQADREMRMREAKLRYGFVATNIQSEGQAVTWDKALWDALDETDPRILSAVLAAVDEASKGVEDEPDPT